MSDTTLPATKKREAYTAHWRQIHAWGVGGITDYFMWEQFYLIMNIHTTVFRVSALAVGTILSTPRLIDGILDPILGHWSDNLKSKWGRRKPFMLVSGILGAILAATMFSMSPDWPQWVKCAMVAFFAIGLFVAVGTYDMTFTALGYELSEAYDDRSRVQAIRNVYWGLGGIVGGYVVWLASRLPTVGNFLFGRPGDTWRFVWLWPEPWWKLWTFNFSVIFPHPDHAWLSAWMHWRSLVSLADGSGNQVIGFRVVSLAIGCFMLVAMIFPLRWSKERYDVKVNRQHVNLGAAFKATLTNRPFVIWLIMNFASGAGSLSRNLFFFIGVYYVCYGDMAQFTAVKGGGTAIVGFLLSLLVWPMVKPITKLIGKQVAIIGGAALALVQVCGYPFIATPGHIYQWFWYDNAFLIPSMLLGAVTAGIMPDICDIDELGHGERREGLFTAVVSFMSKMQMSIMMLLTGVFLTWTGFEGGVTHQPPAVLHRLVMLGFTPLIVINLITLILACFFPISARMMKVVRTELDARHMAAGVLADESGPRPEEPRPAAAAVIAGALDYAGPQMRESVQIGPEAAAILAACTIPPLPRRAAMGMLGGAFIGLLAGYPLSYLFQAGMVRFFFSLGQYISHAGRVLSDKKLAPTAIGIWVLSVFVLAIVGLALGLIFAKPKTCG